MHASWSNLAVGYLVIGLLIAGLPVIFFIITFLPGLMRTTGEHISEVRSAHLGTIQSRSADHISPSQLDPVSHQALARGPRNFANTP
jgi:hypothetical protein